MCGIFGILTTSTTENIYKQIINGLIQLQNRGYDSSGLGIVEQGHTQIDIHKYASTGSLDSLVKLREKTAHLSTPKGGAGIGHNRWATHGMKTDKNAHPHLSQSGRFAIVHNGIIENYAELRDELMARGFTFRSQTDSEVIVNLVEYYAAYESNANTYDSLNCVIQRLHGTYGIILVDVETPNHLFCVRNGSPLLVGKTDNTVLITSEQSGFCNQVSNYITLNNDDICVISSSLGNGSGSVAIKTTSTYLRKKAGDSIRTMVPDPYPHWTIREIFEQPAIVNAAINNGGRIKSDTEVKLGGLEQHADQLTNTKHVILLGCGTSYFACLYGMHFFKALCGFTTVQAFDGAEMTEHDIPRDSDVVFVLVSQSGETKDLHRCIELAKNANITTIGIINVVDSLIAREVDCGVYCNAGVEVGVASTKAFSSQVVCLSLLAIWFSQIAGINAPRRAKAICDLKNLSNDFTNVLEMLDGPIRQLAETRFQDTHNVFLIGKGTDEIVAREGSLKVKEIAYIHAEGYSSSSLKHGPFALLDEQFPVIIFNMDRRHSAKTMNCVEEVLSRGSPVFLVTNDRHNTTDARYSPIYVPNNGVFSSLLGIVPVQLLAYYLSVARGINPDKPKNLAKVVTVE
jgi:glucosamine--fructose-6-phosphate aminotransferase (isomerizing)